MVCNEELMSLCICFGFEFCWLECIDLGFLVGLILIYWFDLGFGIWGYECLF